MNKKKYIIGIDEVGRGPIAGPVMVAAFCIQTKDEEYVFHIFCTLFKQKHLECIYGDNMKGLKSILFKLNCYI